MKLRTLASLGLAAGTALALATAVSPAQAAAKTTISIHVENVKNQPIKNAAVFAEKGDDYVFAGTTNANGNLSKSPGLEGTFSAGTWKFTVEDYDTARNTAGTAYAPKSFTAALTKGENENFGTKTLAAGIRISGTVRAPSGRVVRNAEVRAFTQREPGSLAARLAGSDSKGVYRLYALTKDTYYVRAYTGATDGRLSTFAKVVASKAGASYTGNTLKSVQVRCQADLEVTPQFYGVDLTVTADGSGFGLTNPGGTATILRDGETLTTVDFSDRASWTQSREESAGKHTYAVQYSGGDCYSWSKSRTVTVEGSAVQ